MQLHHVKLISAYWDKEAQSYKLSHPEHADIALHPSWGLHHIPEEELKLIPQLIPGQRLVELGCGDGHDAIGFANKGLEVIAIDVSTNQLALATPNDRVTYLNCSAESLPINADSVDYVISDHGAFDHSPVDLLLAEVNRVLKPGGLLIICTYSPLAIICFDPQTETLTRSLHSDYPTRTLISDQATVAAQYSYSEWIRAFRTFGFTIERLEELKAPPSAKAYFSDLVSTAWGSRWPCDIVWVVRRALV